GSSVADAVPPAEVEIHPLDPDAFRSVLSERRFEELEEARARVGDVFDGRTLWNVNPTARGGGVAEMLASLLASAAGAGVTARWLVTRGTPEFFRVTKRIHNRLHGTEGDGGPLGDDERRIYEETLEPQAGEL